MITPLSLSPLPTLRSESEPSRLTMEREGFVDEAVVTALRTNTEFTRCEAYPEDLALAADDMDFAGWRVTPAPADRDSPLSPPAADEMVRRATPPWHQEPGLGSPHQGSPRWWLAGLIGVLCTLLVSVLLLTLAARPGSTFETILTPRVLTAAPSSPARVPENTVVEPALTDVSSDRP